MTETVLVEQQLAFMELPPTGKELRDEALERLEERRARWVAEAKDIAERLARAHGTVTADDLRTAYPVPPEYDARVVGAVFKDKRFVKMGYRATSRATSHARPIAVFRLRR